MQNDLNPERVAQLSEAVLATLRDVTELQDSQALNEFAQSKAITISHAHFYILFGTLNFPRLDDGRIMFAGVTAAQAAKLLSSSPSKIGRWLMTLTEKGLLGRDVAGAYKITDVSSWFELAQNTLPYQK